VDGVENWCQRGWGPLAAALLLVDSVVAWRVQVAALDLVSDNRARLIAHIRAAHGWTRQAMAEPDRRCGSRSERSAGRFSAVRSILDRRPFVSRDIPLADTRDHSPVMRTVVAQSRCCLRRSTTCCFADTKISGQLAIIDQAQLAAQGAQPPVGVLYFAAQQPRRFIPLRLGEHFRDMELA